MTLLCGPLRARPAAHEFVARMVPGAGQSRQVLINIGHHDGRAPLRTQLAGRRSVMAGRDGARLMGEIPAATQRRTKMRPSGSPVVRGSAVSEDQAGAAEAVVNLGARLKHRRQLSGMSLREVARQLAVSPSFVSQLENGKS